MCSMPGPGPDGFLTKVSTPWPSCWPPPQHPVLRLVLRVMCEVLCLSLYAQEPGSGTSEGLGYGVVMLT